MSFFLVYDLPTYDKKDEILPLALAYIVHLHSQFNHVFALLISTPRLKSNNFNQNTPKFK